MTFKHLEIAKDLFLLEQEVVKPEIKKNLGGINHIWLTDYSQSMSSTVKQLGEDIIQLSHQLRPEDTLTLGWFSGEGQRGFLVKGYRSVDQKGLEALVNMVRSNSYTRGLTCFSEILADVDQAITDLTPFSDQFSLVLLTDGYPVVSNLGRELSSITSTITKLSGRVSSSLLVGYGSYYNKELLSDMAAGLGGTLIHSSNLSEFKAGLTNFVTDVRELAGQKLTVRFDKEALVAGTVPFGISGKSLFQYAPDGDTVQVVLSKHVRDAVYMLVRSVPKESEAVEIRVNDAKRFDKQPVAVAAYGAALLATQRTKTNLALEILGKLGDVALIDAVSNAYTNDEYGRAERVLRAALNSPEGRFTRGQKLGYLPPANAFSLLDLVQLVTADPQAHFHPLDPGFEYSRIGAKSKKREGTPVFTADPGVKCDLESLVWHKSRLNLSLRVKIDGKVALQAVDGKEPADFGLATNHPAHIYRTFTLVKDGLPNLASIPLSLSSATFAALQAEGCIEPTETWVEGAVYQVALNTIPVVNRATAEGKTSAVELCRKVLDEHQLKATIKTLKWAKDNLISGNYSTRPTYGEAAKEFLKANFVDPSTWVFSAPSDVEEASDFYLAKTFEIKTKGLSSLPKIDDVRKKLFEISSLAKTKPLTPAEKLVATGVTLVESYKGMTSPVRLAKLTEELTAGKKELNRIRSDIQHTKFAILLGKRWFDEFTSRTENTVKVDGFECAVLVGEEKVAY